MLISDSTDLFKSKMNLGIVKNPEQNRIHRILQFSNQVIPTAVWKYEEQTES